MLWTWFILAEFSMITKTPSRALKRGRLRNLNVRSLLKKRRIIASPRGKTSFYGDCNRVPRVPRQTGCRAEKLTIYAIHKCPFCQAAGIHVHYFFQFEPQQRAHSPQVRLFGTALHAAGFFNMVHFPVYPPSQETTGQSVDGCKKI